MSIFGEQSPQPITDALEILRNTFGVVEFDEATFFYHTPHIITQEPNPDHMDGSAQRVPPCGDQTPAYLGLNGPIFEEPDTPRSELL